MEGPTTSGALAPYLFTKPPDQRESKNKMRMNGSQAAPAAVAEYSWTWIKLSGKKNIPPPKAVYRKSVSRFAPLKLRERNSARGNIGFGQRASTSRKTASESAPPKSVTSTNGWPKPNLEDSIRPYTSIPNPSVA